MESKEKIDLNQVITDRIIAELDKGIIPWHRPWTGTRNGAWSRSTGRAYSLLNQMILGKPGEYLTYQQAKEAGGYVRKGEKARTVVFWKQVAITDKDADGNDKKKIVPMLKYFSVFHVDQCEGITQKYHPENVLPPDPIAEADSIVSAYTSRTGCLLEHSASNKASYRPSQDCVFIDAA